MYIATCLWVGGAQTNNADWTFDSVEVPPPNQSNPFTNSFKQH